MIGLLWMDTDLTNRVEEKVKRAADRYFKKYGSWPNWAYVNPGELEPDSLELVEIAEGVIPMEGLRSVLPLHVWVVNNTQKKKQPKTRKKNEVPTV